MYVATLEFGVRLIGAWSTLMILLSCCQPESFTPCSSTRRLFNNAAVSGYSASITNELFPDPETPVTHVSAPSGNLAVTFLRLCTATFVSVSHCRDDRRRGGSGIRSSPRR